ncbi:MAG: carboxypeptidase regulatory-like domain-containing protein [Bacteroidetes bacterium]|nr:carboxypeptidase regulatory-like domain-containing protein [Bacteroidota bacterium]
MDDKQKDHQDTIDRVAQFNTDHSVEIAAIADYGTPQGIFDGARAQINLLGQRQSQDDSGLEILSITAKKAMAKTVNRLAKKARVKAKLNGDLALAESLSHSYSYIYKADKQTAIDRTLAMRKAMNDNLATLTNVSAGDITLIDNSVTTFDAAQVLPIVAREAKKTESTNQLPGQYDIAFEAIDDMFDLLFGEYSESNPFLVQQFQLAMQIIETGVHHTGIKVIVTGPIPPDDPAGVPLNHVKVKILEYEPKRESETNINGEAVIEKFKHGTYDAEFTKPGYARKVVRFTVKRGQHIDIPVTMVLA